MLSRRHGTNIRFMLLHCATDAVILGMGYAATLNEIDAYLDRYEATVALRVVPYGYRMELEWDRIPPTLSTPLRPPGDRSKRLPDERLHLTDVSVQRCALLSASAVDLSGSRPGYVGRRT